jgi:hypothetical protein
LKRRQIETAGQGVLGPGGDFGVIEIRIGKDKDDRGGSVGDSRVLTEPVWSGHSQFRGSSNEALEMESSVLPTNTDRSKYDIIRGRMDHEDGLITSRLN